MNDIKNEVKKVGILDLFIILLERKRVFVFGLLLFCITGVITSYCLTKYYTATAVIMKPAKKMSGLGSLIGKDLPVSGLLKSIDGIGGGDEDNFLSILKSRRLAEKVIDRFNLVHAYRFDKRKKYYFEDVLKALDKNVGILENDLGNIEVSVTDTNPAAAAAMANFMVCELDTITYQLSKESARNSRLFFEDRLSIIKHDLDSASRAFADFQIENKYIDLEQQVKSSIEQIASFEGRKMGLDLEIAQIRSQFSANNQRMGELEKEKSVIEKKIAGYMDQGGGNLIVSLSHAPEKAIKYAELKGNAKLQESLYEFVIQLYEQAKISEANNVPAIQVLEYAKNPQKKTRPKRSIICLMFLFGGFIVTSTYILFGKWWTIQAQHKTVVYMKTRRILDLLSLRKVPA
jgi:tyrosine-protein kinase Etk/Wzc